MPPQYRLITIAAAADYAIVVVLLGRLFEPAGRALSWAVAPAGLAGCACRWLTRSISFPRRSTRSPRSASISSAWASGPPLVADAAPPSGRCRRSAEFSWLTFRLPPNSRSGLAPWDMAPRRHRRAYLHFMAAGVRRARSPGSADRRLITRVTQRRTSSSRPKPNAPVNVPLKGRGIKSAVLQQPFCGLDSPVDLFAAFEPFRIRAARVGFRHFRRPPVSTLKVSEELSDPSRHCEHSRTFAQASPPARVRARRAPVRVSTLSTSARMR